MDRARSNGPPIGELTTEDEIGRSEQEDCPCKKGMFPKSSRRQILRGGGLITAAAASAFLPRRALAADAGDDASWTVPGQIAKSDYGSRSSFEKVVREAAVSEHLRID